MSNGQFPQGGPKTAITYDKRKFTQLTYQLCQLPTLILSHRASDGDAIADLERQVKKLIQGLLAEAKTVTGPNKLSPLQYDATTAIIHRVRLESTVIGPYAISVKVLYMEAFASSPKELILELHPPLYFQSAADL